jgi:hypothetical protein
LTSFLEFASLTLECYLIVFFLAIFASFRKSNLSSSSLLLNSSSSSIIFFFYISYSTLMKFSSLYFFFLYSSSVSLYLIFALSSTSKAVSQTSELGSCFNLSRAYTKSSFQSISSFVRSFTIINSVI